MSESARNPRRKPPEVEPGRLKRKPKRTRWENMEYVYGASLDRQRRLLVALEHVSAITRGIGRVADRDLDRLLAHLEAVRAEVLSQ